MSELSDPIDADVVHWRRTRRAALWLAAAWALVSFGPTLFAGELRFEWMGAPMGVWVAAQGAPMAYVLLVWLYERRASRLDREHRAARGG
jgi:putative solute:sodium symporter small subunit